MGCGAQDVKKQKHGRDWYVDRLGRFAAKGPFCRPIWRSVGRLDRQCELKFQR